MGTARETAPFGVPADRPTGPWHGAVPYTSPTDLGHTLALGFADRVLDGDRVIAVLDEAAGQQLRESLGSAADGVQFPDPRTVHAVPGFTTAARWARTGRELSTPEARTWIVGQQLLDIPGCGPDYWLRLCAGLEVAMAGLPVTVLCPHRDTPAERSRVEGTHPVLATTNGCHPNPAYRPPAEVLRGQPEPPRPDLGEPTAELVFRTGLGAVRRLTSTLAERAGMGPDRAADAVLAVNELASNTFEHGAGTGRLRLWAGDGLRAEVSDGGRLTDPFPGLVHPEPGSPRGRGLWLARELSDVMEVWADHDGTTIRLSWSGQHD